MDFYGDGGRIDTNLGAAVDDGEGHGRSLSFTGTASCGFLKGSRGRVTAQAPNFRRMLRVSF